VLINGKGYDTSSWFIGMVLTVYNLSMMHARELSPWKWAIGMYWPLPFSQNVVYDTVHIKVTDVLT